jgi:protein SCO1/2
MIPLATPVRKKLIHLPGKPEGVCLGSSIASSRKSPSPAGRAGRGRLFLTACVLMLAVLPRPAMAQRFATDGSYGTPAGMSPTAELLRDVRIEQHLDAQLPLEDLYRDESGREVRLGDFFNDRPVVLALVYYRCPMLCTQVLNGFLKTSQAIPLEIGRDFDVVTVSIDPRETTEMAAEKKKHYVRAYRRPGAEHGWHFLTGDVASIDRLAETVGFRYRYDEGSGQFAHASGLMVATPQGRLARYFYGIEFSPPDLRLGLVESSAGRIGSPVDQVLLLCYHYDPLTGKYGLAISFVLRTAGAITVGGLGVFLFSMYRRERKRPRLVRSPDSVASTGGDNVFHDGQTAQAEA